MLLCPEEEDERGRLGKSSSDGRNIKCARTFDVFLTVSTEFKYYSYENGKSCSLAWRSTYGKACSVQAEQCQTTWIKPKGKPAQNTFGLHTSSWVYSDKTSSSFSPTHFEEKEEKKY